MVEDTMTTGRSTLQAVDAVREHGTPIVGVLTLVDRSSNAKEVYAAQGLPLISLYSAAELVAAARQG
jgi:orotate phosphoribosyltransferase